MLIVMISLAILAILSLALAVFRFFSTAKASSNDEVFVQLIETIIFLLLAIFLLLLSVNIDRFKFW